MRAWKEERSHNPGGVFIPLVFALGEAYQFDWSYEVAEMAGRATQVKVAHLRLCHSRAFLTVAYRPRPDTRQLLETPDAVGSENKYPAEAGSV